MNEPHDITAALVAAARDRAIRDAAELWARLRRDPAVPRAAVREAERRLLELASNGGDR